MVAVGEEDVGSGFGVPEVDGVILAARNDIGAVRRPGDSIDIAKVAIIGT